MFIALLYMFRATICPSSGENTVPMQRLVFVILYGCLSGMQGGVSLYIGITFVFGFRGTDPIS
jgi:hypothetical protein